MKRAVNLRCGRTEKPPVRVAGAESLGAGQDAKIYWPALAVVVVGALVIIQWFTGNLKDLVDLATTVSFVLAPVLAVFGLAPVVEPVRRRRSGAL